MRISMVICKQAQPVLGFAAGGLNLNKFYLYKQKNKIIFVLGPTGSGKSRLAIDLATRFPAEIINSDKMQIYKDLDIVTNKVTEEEKCGIPHHLLSIANAHEDFTSKDFCNMASMKVESIVSKGQLPIIVGGSNSYIEALVDDRVNNFRSRYDCCFLWMDVSMPILHSFVSDRVDRMVEYGMVDEVRKLFKPNGDYSQGIRKAIGVPEFDKYFREEAYLDEATRRAMLKQAIDEVKINTCKLACRQLEKIHRLRNHKGWKIHRIDATEVFIKRGTRVEADEAWERHVMGPSSKIVTEFLYDFRAKVMAGRMGSIGEVAKEAVLAAVAAS